MKKCISALMAMTLSLSLLAGCGGGKVSEPTPGTATPGASTSEGTAGTAAVQDDKIVNIAISENAITLDPHAYNNLGSDMILFEVVYEGLVMSDGEGHYWPWLAKDWSYNEDGTVWTFELRDDVDFNNGDHFTSKDVVASYQRILDEGANLARGVMFWPEGLLKSVEAKGDYTVEITLNRTHASVLYSFARTAIIPADKFAEDGKEMFYNQDLVATGPWILDEWVDGQYAHYNKNENYWNAENYDSYYEELYIRHVLESSSSVASHLAGDLDANITLGGMSPDMIKMYGDKAPQTELLTAESSAFYYMGLQCEKGGAFEDLKVRQAFDMAIDRQVIVDVVMGGGTPTKSFVAEGNLGFDAELPAYEYNPEKAAQLLEESGYDGRLITLSSNTSTTKSQDQLLAISGMLNEVGFNTEVEIVESATLLEMRLTGEYDAFLVVAMHQGGDPGVNLYQRITADVHNSHFVDDEMNNYITTGLATMDDEERSDLYAKAMARMREVSAPISGLYGPYARQAINYGVTGIVVGRDGSVRLAFVNYDENSTNYAPMDFDALTGAQRK